MNVKFRDYVNVGLGNDHGFLGVIEYIEVIKSDSFS